MRIDPNNDRSWSQRAVSLWKIIIIIIIIIIVPKELHDKIKITYTSSRVF